MISFKTFLVETTLQYHTTLNPDLWDGMILKSEVRDDLLRFIEIWRKFAKIPKNLVQDIIMTGGNANFNYTSMSDIDVHLMIDRTKLSSDPTLIDDYLQAKKTLWQRSHNVTIYGYSLEPYAEDVSKVFPKNQAVYSLIKNEWIKPPIYGDYDFNNNQYVKNRVYYFSNQINSLIDSESSVESFEPLKQELKNMRTIGIQRDGEFSNENQIFKELRDSGILQKMSDYIRHSIDKSLSLYKTTH